LLIVQKRSICWHSFDDKITKYTYSIQLQQTSLLFTEYVNDEMNHDIALCALYFPVPRSHSIVPICLSSKIGQNLDRMAAETSGWGICDDNPKDRLPCLLHSMTMTTITNQDCNIIMKNNYKDWNTSQMTDNVLCAIDDEHKSAVTSGDSGGS
jgi:hypothetical protein